MPLYDYRCTLCDNEWEAAHRIKDRDSELCKCGEKANLVIKQATGGKVSYNYFDHALDTHITSPEQRKKLIKEKGLFEI